MMSRWILFCVLLAAWVNADEAQYEAPPKPSGVFLLETFQGKLKDLGWISSEKDKYEGEFKISAGSKSYLEGDTGLYVPEKAMHYAISKQVDISSTNEKDFIAQYQVRYDDYPTCGGAYLKFVLAPFKDLANWDDKIPYSVMFGPDKCGSDSKVHFIMQIKNEKSGELVEHHLKNPPKPSGDKDNHLFTLAVFQNQSFAILMDNEIERVGSLRDDFEPPVQPPAEIDDPEDKKPDDWVDEEEISDPEAKKPDDWDESEPEFIPDADDKKPEEWLDDEPESIPDPDAVKPADWDDDEDGEWEAPVVDNPKCAKAGCGKWEPKLKKNPAYKGKWTAPMVANPAYKGEWKPKKIPNPDYYEVESVHIQPISAVGLEIWTMDKGYTFDNILLGDSLEAAQEYAKATFGKAKEAEQEQKQKEIDEMAKKKSFDDDGNEEAASSTDADQGEELKDDEDDAEEEDDGEKAEL